METILFLLQTKIVFVPPDVQFEIWLLKKNSLTTSSTEIIQ